MSLKLFAMSAIVGVMGVMGVLGIVAMPGKTMASGDGPKAHVVIEASAPNSCLMADNRNIDIDHVNPYIRSVNISLECSGRTYLSNTLMFDRLEIDRGTTFEVVYNRSETSDRLTISKQAASEE